MGRSHYYILASDFGQKLGFLDLYTFFSSFEKAKYNISTIRRLKNLAYSDLKKFIETIRLRRNFREFLKEKERGNSSFLAVIVKYRLLTRTIKEYVQFIEQLETIGIVSYNTIFLDDDFSPFFSRRKELPLQVKIDMGVKNQQLKNSYLTVNLYSTGLIISRVNYIENENADKVLQDEDIYGIIKQEIKNIKDLIVKESEITITNYAYYYSDRHKLTLLQSNDLINHSWNLAEKFLHEENKFIQYYLSYTQSFFVNIEVNELSNNYFDKCLAIFELALFQRYFLNTRDSYIDKSIKTFSSTHKSKVIEHDLIDFIEILREVQFIKDEGGNYKLFNNEDLLNVYNNLSKAFNLISASTYFESKSSRALSFFDTVLSIKRERTNVRLSYIMLILNAIMIIDIIIRLWMGK